MLDSHKIAKPVASTTIPVPKSGCLIINKALENFRGIERRFSYHGATSKGTEVFDDYGHHPAEIEQTLLVAKRRAKGKLVVVFQPHRFSRTHKLWDSFVTLFANHQIDHLVITDIYPASEQPISGVNSESLVRDIKAKNPNIKISYVPISDNFEQIIQEVDQKSEQNDLILLLGAGKINQIAKKITCF